jgi:DNA-binding NtrC family response regulator
VRELRNIVIRLTMKYPGQKLSPSELEPEFDLDTLDGGEPGLSSVPGTLVEQAQRHCSATAVSISTKCSRPGSRGYIEAAMKLTRGNVSQAAKMLGINRTTLYSRMESLQKQQ